MQFEAVGIFFPGFSILRTDPVAEDDEFVRGVQFDNHLNDHKVS